MKNNNFYTEPCNVIAPFLSYDGVEVLRLYILLLLKTKMRLVNVEDAKCQRNPREI